MIEVPFLLNFVRKLVFVTQVPTFFICGLRSFGEFYPNSHLIHFGEWKLFDKF